MNLTRQLVTSALALLLWPGPARASALTFHTIFSTECNAYFDWQSLGLLYSFRKVKQSGAFTRLMACDKSPPPGAHVVPDTHVHPNYAVHPRTKDSYSPYNKPFSIQHWLQHAKPTADFIIVLDADMVFRTAMTVDMLGVEKGRPISAHYGYLVGVFKENYMKIKERVPNVENAQQVGGFTVMHREDLEKVAPQWLYWTEEVRGDPESWGNTGDIFNGNGKAGPPWISEMYGYVFACAEVGVRFKVSNNVMLYPGYQPPPDPWPAVLHYGITYNVDEYAFDKHWFMTSDFTSCPGRIFNKPMLPGELSHKPGSMEYRRKTVALTVATVLYESTKWWSGYHCNRTLPDPPKKAYGCTTMANGVVSCREVTGEQAQSELVTRLRGEESAGDQKEECKEENINCCDWAAKGECDSNPSFMLGSCQRSCDLCGGGCKEGCCPPKAAVLDTEAVATEKDKIEEDVESAGVLYTAHVSPSPPPHALPWAIDGTDRSRTSEGRRTETGGPRDGAKATTADGKAAGYSGTEGTDERAKEEEDYDYRTNPSSVFGDATHWSTLLGVGSGSLLTVFMMAHARGAKRTVRLRGKEKTVKGSQ